MGPRWEWWAKWGGNRWYRFLRDVPSNYTCQRKRRNSPIPACPLVFQTWSWKLSWATEKAPTNTENRRSRKLVCQSVSAKMALVPKSLPALYPLDLSKLEAKEGKAWLQQIVGQATSLCSRNLFLKEIRKKGLPHRHFEQTWRAMPTDKCRAKEHLIVRIQLPLCAFRLCVRAGRQKK